MTSRPMICTFDNVEPDLALLGGKGANLVRLTQAGFRVPPGFCITTEAYQAAVAAGGLRQRIVAMAEAADYNKPDALETTTASIRHCRRNAGFAP